jgi:hypothetical protein
MKISCSGSLITAAMRSRDSISTYSASISLLIQSILWIAHLPSLQVEGTIFVYLWCPIEVVKSRPWILLAWGSWIANTTAFWVPLSFIKLSCTAPCFLTFSWITRRVLVMMWWVELPIVFAVWFVRASAWNALWNHLVAATVVMALRGTFGTSLCVLALESLMSNLLTIVALH